ncbi:MAG: hypothetical protein QOD71_813 [Thermoleophilaceae bacterium]|nr:hypothetical protein [Thermoleophilaceae bacterium]
MALLLAALLASGCGAGAGAGGPGGLTLSVTRDFGHRKVDSARLAKVPDGATALSLLRSESDVRAPGPGWSFFVNGVRPDTAPGQYDLSPGDRVQWDHRRRGAGVLVRAVVGAFPEPFRHGLQGERRPVRVECDDAESAPCLDAKQKLESVDVPVSGSSLGAPGTEHVTRLVVARWPRARIVRGGFTLERGPERSGVFARFSADGATLYLLDENGHVARTVHPGDGTALVAALRPRADELLWLVTALDERGLAAGVRALREDRLRNAYAVAVTGRTVEKLPL